MKLAVALTSLLAVASTGSAAPTLGARWDNVCEVGYGLVCCNDLEGSNCSFNFYPSDIEGQCQESREYLLFCCPGTVRLPPAWHVLAPSGAAS